MEIKKPNFEQNFTPKPNLDEKPTKKKIKNDVKVNINNAVEEVPVVATHEKKNLKKILIALAIVLVIGITATVVFLIPSPVRSNDIYVEITADELTPSSFDFSNIDESRVEKDEFGNIVKITMLPGDKFNGCFGVSSTTDPNADASPGPVFIRFRMFATIRDPQSTENTDNYYGNIISCKSIGESMTKWYVAKDGYIYYNEILKADEHASIDTEIELIGKNMGNELQGKTLTLHISFNALQAEAHQSILEEWPTAPYQWRTTISEKYLGEFQHD